MKLAVEAFLSIFAWIGISVFTVSMTFLIALAYSVHRFLDPDLKFTHYLASVWGRGLVALSPGCRVQVIGRENLPHGRPVILMANHQSYSDVPLLYFLRYPFKWVADEPLFRIPFFGWSMRMCGYIPVKRGDPKESSRSLEETKRWLGRGVSIFFFPEGTRSHTGVFGRFRTGGFRLAVTTQTPIVPVVLVGSRQFLPRGSWIFRLRVRPQIHIQPPIEPTTYGLRQVHQLARHVRGEMFRVYHPHLREVQ